MSATGGIEVGDVCGGWGGCFAGVEVGSILTNIGFRCGRTGHHPTLIFARMIRNPIVLIITIKDITELRINRDPLPLTGKNEIAWF
jgi:hypothetical protein